MLCIENLGCMKTWLGALFLIFSLIGISQTEDTLYAIHKTPIDVIDKVFLKQYRTLKPKVIKVYPYALYAAEVLAQLENDMVKLKKRRAKRKLCKLSYKNLKSDFKYALQDLYISEGQVLMKLISRETNMTVHEIIKKYRGTKDAAMFNLMGQLFDQDIKAKYVPKKEYVLEYIVRQIETGEILISDTPKIITKSELNEQEKIDKTNRKRYKKAARALKRQKRKDKREKKKATTQ